ncbi:DoxX family protein [Roseovarius sp. Pro17]|uniref:DoxX family protein n=1 Tax=Roseovarius sp. Pro17 TaxID=3108175 RepID=UPI002D76FE0B|nr:DoxX family protein [Roseovarius sp. Pro17]
MNTLIARYNTLTSTLERADGLLSLLARILFAAILMVYFWVSGLTKLGDGILGLFQPAMGAYAQIFPKAMETAGYDVSQLNILHTLVVLAGTWAEFILPALIVFGLATRLAALGMIGFITVQSLTDMFGHGLLADPGAVGAWFDKVPDAIIMDQRALWIFPLIVLVIKGAGPLSLDRLAEHRLAHSSL